jgi:cob(I)alamin adenosyltransferase
MAAVPLEKTPAEPLTGGWRREQLIGHADMSIATDLPHAGGFRRLAVTGDTDYTDSADDDSGTACQTAQVSTHAGSVAGAVSRCQTSGCDGAPIILGVKIYTKTGDSGETGLFDGTRVGKSDPRVSAYGEVDELNAWLGAVRATGVDEEISSMLERIQRDLFALGARLADPSKRIADRVTKAAISDADIARLEGWIDRLEEELSPLRRFILAGGSPGGAWLHVARTVCRRAERAMVGLGREALEPGLIVYVNRLSDLLFVMARAVNRRAGVAETEW